MTPVHLVFEGKPCPKNNKHRAHATFRQGIGRHLSVEFKEFRALVHAMWCQARARGAQPFGSQPVRVTIAAHWPTRRRVDIDAAIEPTLDALTFAGVWDDDSQVVELSATKGYDKERPRVEVEIAGYEPGRV